MIRPFRDKDTEAIWYRHDVKKLGPELSRLAYNKLILINTAEGINDLRVPPGNRLEKRAITADTALRPSRALGLSDMFFINMQAHYDAEIALATALAAIDRIA